MNRMEMRDIPLKYWLALFILAVIYVINLQFNLVIDAGKYTAVAKEIYETGNWIHLKVLGEPYDQKPPLMFWLSALSFHLFGLSNWAFKLPTLLFTLLGTYSVFRLGGMLYGKKTGFYSAIMLLFSQCVILYNNDTHTDIMMTMSVIFGIWQLCRFVEDGSRLGYVLGFVGVGMAMMTKGPIGLAIPVFALLPHVLILKKYHLLSPLVWLPGLLILCAFLAPTLIGLYDQFGWDGIKFYFWTNNAGRIDGSYAGHQHDHFFCFHTVLYLLLPFSILLYYGIFQEIKRWSKVGFSFLGVREGVTFAAPIYLLILSFASQQSPQYMLPVIPILVILTAKWTVRLLENGVKKSTITWLISLQNGLLLLACLATFVVPTMIFPTKSIGVWSVMILMLCYVFYVVLMAKTDVDKVIGIPLVAVLMLNMMLSIHFFPRVFNNYDATANAAKDFNKLAGDNAKLFSYNSIDVEFGFYGKNQPRYITGCDDNRLQTESEPWLYADKKTADSIFEKYPKAKIVKVYKYKKISQMNLKFLNPKTRSSTLKDRFLIKIKND